MCDQKADLFHFAAYVRHRQNNGKATDEKKEDLASALSAETAMWCCGPQWRASRQTQNVFFESHPETSPKSRASLSRTHNIKYASKAKRAGHVSGCDRNQV